ncbi:kinesin-like protein KIN-7F isoform X2 [Aristolochia californica]|uniref:kinesin-like protein KIN-7F isoform X2 n=1 Tax=Aristolochia californica TaxID=171875 RepID=UPI0035D5E284
MGVVGGEDLLPWEKMQHVSVNGNGNASPNAGVGGEKILVSVRLRPLNEREISRNDVSDWECIDDHTIMFRNSLPERSMFPTAYTFDRVFRSDSYTHQVYEEAAKHVVLSVVSGINASVFAYGQTSSGKTFTMSGITENSVADIYDYIEKHDERAFVMKFSAMEIYNEAVRDLLSSDGTQLRLLDDPERGTIVERLTEEILRDRNHLQELLSICEAQRQIGETSLNETSSRSHQILRLTIESSAREFLGKDNSSTLSASVNFVDLAGSERASQAQSAGTRLKEGCHINRSLLTLGTVIRKLSKGRNTHIPYRDSKLTRILQPSLGGNARTAIICTMSPARSHLEQSRNTLLFASCAKQVATDAHVNVVMSDKALVKHLQKELARLESELRTPGPVSSTGRSDALMREKDAQIRKMEKEIKELTQQRDLIQSRLEDLLRVVGDDDQPSKLWGDFGDPPPFSLPNTLDDEISLSEESIAELSLDFLNTSQYSRYEELCKDVRCIEAGELVQNRKGKLSVAVAKGNEEHLPLTQTNHANEKTDLELEPAVEGDRELKLVHTDSKYGVLEKQLLDVQKTINDLVKPLPDEPSPRPCSNLMRSRSCRASFMMNSSCPLFESEQNENTPPSGLEKDLLAHIRTFQKRPCSLKYNETEVLSSTDSQISEHGASDTLKEQNIKGGQEENITSIQSFVDGLKEMAKLQYEKLDVDGQEMEAKGSGNLAGEKILKDVGLDPMQIPVDSPACWSMEFEKQQQEIIELWDACNVSLVHRTYFFLLFKGDPADLIYMEVELRRLSFLKVTFSRENHSQSDSNLITPASSMRALRREKEMLSRQMQKKLTPEERENLYKEWGIGLGTKQRRLQLARRIWTDTSDMNHIRSSASLVAKLVGLLDPGEALKEMFGLSFSPQMPKRKSFRWKSSVSTLV